MRNFLLNIMFLCVVLIASSMPLFAQSSWVPNNPVEFVVPHGVGGGADVFARIMAKVMFEEKLVPVSVQVVNQPGGGGAVGTAYVLANKAANPHTLVLVNNPLQATPLTVPGAPGLKDLLPIYNFMLDDFVLIVRGNAPWKSAKELVEAAKKMPPKSIKAGAGGPTGGDAMALQAFTRAIGIEMNKVTFNSGGEVLPALLGGHVDIGISNPIEYIGHLKSGALRALGVFRESRYEDMPDIPTMKEQGINAKAIPVWRGVAMPKGVPQEAVTYWVQVMDKVAASPTIQKYLKDSLVTPTSMKGPELLKFLSEQEERYKIFLAQ